MSLDIEWDNIPENETLKQNVIIDSPLKKVILNYVGENLNPSNDEITVEMIIEIMSKEFPEFVMALAEENWLRGYQQGVEDLETIKQDLDSLKEE